MSEQAIPLLAVHDLRVAFATDQGVARAVDGVSFSVESGEVVGIVGESGCGKSVTALSILGLLATPPARVLEQSSIRFAGEELLGMDRARLREIRGGQIAIVFQEPMTSLNPVYSVGAQVAEVLRHHRGMRQNEARAATMALFEEVGLYEPAVEYESFPHQLSGGMRQRVMIAMALAGEPRLIIADEPTTALDVTVQAQILALLARVRADHGTAVLLISHDLGVIGELCDRVIVMYAGQVVEVGSVSEVLGSPAHPYTRALLASRPVVVSDGDPPPLSPIKGVVPSATAWPFTCRFLERCPEADGECDGAAPELVSLGDHRRRSRCHHVVDVVEDVVEDTAGGLR